MNTTKVKNVVFDIGNVLVKWSPVEIVNLTFGNSSDTQKLVNTIFQNELWAALNKGKLSEESAKIEYKKLLEVDVSTIDTLFFQIKDTQELLEGTSELLKQLNIAGYSLFALTDNVKEIIQYLRSRYTFWQYFSGVVVSAEVECMKPDQKIFNHLLTSQNILAEETVFIDDLLLNIQGAKAVGISGIHFKGSELCKKELKSMGLVF